MLLAKCNEISVWNSSLIRIRKKRHQFQLERRIDECSSFSFSYYLKNHIKEKTRQLDEVY